MMQQQHRSKQGKGPRVYTTAEIAQYEYCPLVWWHEQFDPLANGETEDLFAQMVEMEYAHGPQATGLPDYQVIEQVLVKRGAFEKDGIGRIEGIEGSGEVVDQYAEQMDDEEAIMLAEAEEEEGISISQKMLRLRTLAFAALGGGVVLLLLSVASGFIISH